MSTSHNKIKLKDNPRFYLIVSTILISIIFAVFLSIKIQSTDLYWIRLQQVYGLFALIYLYLALIVSPLKSLIGNKPFIKSFEFQRRAIGVSAAYFAFLHSYIAFFNQLEGFSGIKYYPEKFAKSMILGLIGLIILALLAFTSFDKIVDILKFKNWKLLHRLSYIAGIIILLHVWIVGTHIAYDWVKILLFILLALFAVLESWRLATVIYANSKSKNNGMKYILFTTFLILFVVVILVLPQIVDSYHEGHGNYSGH